MSLSLLAVYFSAVLLFLLLLMSLGFQPRFISRIAGALLLVSGVLGTLFYGYGYYTIYRNIPQAVARTLFSVFCMFLGRNEISAISSLALFESPVMLVGVYLCHLLALYCTASAVVATIGTRVVRMLHLLLIRRGELSLIYGVNEQTLSFAQKLPGKRIFVGSDSAAEGRILHMGGLLFCDENAQTASPELLRRIGMRSGKRRLNIYCLHSDPSANLRYARRLLRALEERGIRPEQTALTLILPDESVCSVLQSDTQHYGYGSVLAYEREALLSRLMIHAFPPYKSLRFGTDGAAEEDFEALIVGFGKTGQAALRALVMNSQFAGSRFRATVVARDYTQQAGGFFSRFPALSEQYDIRFINADARSVEVCQRIEESGAGLRYVVLCTGNEKTSAEIAVEYARLFSRIDIEPLILQCGAAEIRREQGGVSETVSAFTPEILCSDALDEKAMLLNARYRNSTEDVRRLWAECDYFSRMSCRASADFTDAYVYAAGADRDSVMQPDYVFPPRLLENLARTEHMRWCAFHFAMGYRPMPESVWEQRARQYLLQKQQNKPTLRIGKDSRHRLHACLIDWEALDGLSQRENAVTGGSADYQQLDRDSIAAIPLLLRTEGGSGHA